MARQPAEMTSTKTQKSVKPSKVADVAKLRALKILLPGSKELVDFSRKAVLSPRKPYVHGVAGIQFRIATIYDVFEDIVYFLYETSSIFWYVPPAVNVSFNVNRKDAVHILHRSGGETRIYSFSF